MITVLERMITMLEKDQQDFNNLFSPHQLRVLEEREELSDRITKLEAFANSPTFRQLDSVEQGLLTTQTYYMIQYEEVLKERIQWFINKIKTNTLSK